MTEEERLAKNKQISQTKRSTIERHANMLIRTFSVKIQYNKCSKAQKEALQRIFLEQKWYKNYILNWSKETGLFFNKFDTKQKVITKKNAKMEDEEVSIKYLSAQSRQALVNRMISNVRTEHTLKVKGLQKPGMMHFSKEETVIGLPQANVSMRILTSKRVKIAGLPKSFQVNGLDQFLNIPNLEVASSILVHKATGYFVNIVTYIPKENKKENKIDKTLGIDFGCSTAFTTSEGKKISVSVPESERLKRLQKQMAKKQKGSKNWLKKVGQVKKEYQKITNRKDDLANKLVHEFSQYKTVVIQDEQLKNWHKGGHGKAVQHSVLGRVKAKLLKKPNTVVLSKTVPTTKLCTKCGQWHDELKVWNRIFKCDCGIEMDRDVHAAKNMVWFFENNVGVEHTKIKRMEMEALVESALSAQNQPLSMKYEADESLAHL